VRSSCECASFPSKGRLAASRRRNSSPSNKEIELDRKRFRCEEREAIFLCMAERFHEVVENIPKNIQIIGRFASEDFFGATSTINEIRPVHPDIYSKIEDLMEKLV